MTLSYPWLMGWLLDLPPQLLWLGFAVVHPQFSLIKVQTYQMSQKKLYTFEAP